MPSPEPADPAPLRSTSGKEGRSRSRSRSPSRNDRNQNRGRSRSPPRKPKSGGGGFRWKEKPRRDEVKDDREFNRNDRDRDAYVSSRYRRDRSPDRRRNDYSDRARDGGGRRDRFEPRDRDMERERRPREDRGGDRRERQEKPKQTTRPAAGGNQTYILVTVNDRLGTKAQIPCLPSDPVKLFKAQVAARIGRQPHEIMLKRQGERPFKDQLTLEDYGVSNGVQLDLELDTGD